MDARDNARRYLMLGVALCWLVTGIAYSGVSTLRRWNPETVAILSYAAALLTTWLAVFPHHEFAYRLAGTAAVGSLLFRMASVVMGLWFADDIDAIWIGASTFGATIMLLTLYGRWWIQEVGPWHVRFRGRDRDDSG